MQANAVVEDLLRRLPGLHVDPDGSVIYNGEKIEHILVDGVDIFGSDPTMVTRNFDAAKIAKVEILERKTERTMMTGVDDGTRTKTLNLVLKEGARSGYFGKIQVGGDANGYYMVNGSLAAFRNKEQFTAVGLAANTGITYLMNDPGSGSEGINFVGGSADVMGASAGLGIPRLDGVTSHYANTWNQLRNQCSADFQYSHYETDPVTVTQTIQTQPDSTYGQSQQSKSHNLQSQSWAYAMYDWVLSARQEARFVFHGSKTQGENKYDAIGSSIFNGTLVNRSERIIRDAVAGGDLGGNAWWRVKIGKGVSRIFSVSAEATQTDNTTNGYLYSTDEFYQPSGLVQSIDTADQRKVIRNRFLSFGGTLNYTEPIRKVALLGLSYGTHYTVNEPLQATYGFDEGKYLELVDSLSGNFRTAAIEQRAIISLQGKSGSFSYAIGTDWVGYIFWQRNIIADSTFRINNNNWAPRVLFNYTPNPSTYIDFYYGTSVQQPGIAQLTPITNNNDPLHVILGNPSLRPAFNQSFVFDFRYLKTWMVNIGLKMNLANNDFTTKVTTDSLGRQISQPVNVDGNRAASVNFSMGRKILGIELGWRTTGSYTRSVSYINAASSRNDAYMLGFGLNLNKFVDRKYSAQVGTTVGYFDQISSINTFAPVRYWTQKHQGSVAIYLIPGFEIGTSAIYTWQEKASAFNENTSVLLWNGYMAKNLLHNKLVVRFQFNNLLNTNAGISRTNTENVNTQSSTNILGRYWMVSAVYHFDKKFKK